MRKCFFVFVALVIASVFWEISARGETLRMASKPMTEQYVLSAIMKKLIEHDLGLNVELIQGVGGGASNIMPAMQKGDVDFYPEYTGTGWNVVLKKDGSYKESMFPELQKGYQDLGMQWSGMLGFNNTFGLAMRKETADKYNVRKYSDLAPVADQLIFGAEYDFFERPDGYEALCKAYGLKFKDARDMDIGLKYAAINQGQIDLMNIFTTDGQLSSSNIVMLEDDKKFFPSYACGFVVRNEVLEKFPQLKDIFNKISGSLNDREMAWLNSLVEEKGLDPEEAADEFLSKHNLLK